MTQTLYEPLYPKKNYLYTFCARLHYKFHVNATDVLILLAKKFTLILLHHRISDFVNDYSIEWTVNVPSIWFRHEKRRLIFRNYWIHFWEIDNRNWNEDTLARNKHDRALQKFEAYVVHSNNNSRSIWMSRAVPCYVGDGTCVEFVEQHRPCYIMSSFLSLNLWQVMKRESQSARFFSRED